MPHALDAFVVKMKAHFWRPAQCVSLPLGSDPCLLATLLRRTVLLALTLNLNCVAKLGIRNNYMTGTLAHPFTLNPKVILLIRKTSWKGWKDG